jgi:CubicO group peptidase (beta-lactamase class C family)
MRNEGVLFALAKTGMRGKHAVDPVRYMIAIAAIALLLTTVLPADFADRVDALVRAELTRQHVAGIAVAISYDGKVVLDRGYGVRDRERDRPVDAQTRFALGSITKTFTATLVMQLVAQHRIGLDDRLDRYLPQAPHARELTIRELLAQRTGLADYVTHDTFFGPLARTDVPAPQLLAPIADEPLGFAPGAHFAYSNTNYLLLGMVIEKVTGLPYERALERGLLAPAHLTRIAYGRRALDDEAVGYGVNELAPQWNAALMRGAGALWGDAGDLLQFDAAFFDGRIVAPSSVGTMTALTDSETSPFAYGFGWLLSQVAGHREVWHNGGVPGFNARNSVFPEDRLAIVVLSNGTLFDAGRIVTGTLALIDPGVATRSPAPARVPLDDPKVAALASEVFREMQSGTLDRSRYTAAANRIFPDAIVKALGAQFAELGTPAAVVLRDRHYLGNVQSFTYRLRFEAFSADEILTLDGRGKIVDVSFWPVLDD